MSAGSEPSGSAQEKDDVTMEDNDLIPGVKDADTFSQQSLRAIMQAIRSSNNLPSKGDDFDYYSSFQSFRQVMDTEQNKILDLIQRMMRYLGAKGNLSTNSKAVEIEDKFDVLIDVNDQLLERAGSFLDEAAGLKKKETPLVIASITPKNTTGASWNQKKTPKSTPKSSGYKLLTGRNVQRSQVKFKDKIDNSYRPFIPKIKVKPNAMKPLAESLTLPVEQEVMDESYLFPHPYQYELDHFVPLPDQLEPVEPKVPASLEETALTFIDTLDDLVKMCDVLKKEKEIAIDLEAHTYRTYQGFTCLMQLSTRVEDYIVDTLALRHEFHRMNDIFTDPSIVKVLHGANMDIVWMQRDFGVYMVNMFDTGQAARVMHQHYSLAYLLQLYCNVEADKQYQLADWRIRPLPEELIKYARSDTHYLLYIYDQMKNALLEKGNKQKNMLQLVLQKSKEVCLQTYRKLQLDDASHLKLYTNSKKRFDNRQMEALKGLYAWRDRVAREEDESIGYVLPNHMLLHIAEILPREMQGVLACCNPIPPMVRQCLHEIYGIVSKSREASVTKPIVTPSAKSPTVQIKKSEKEAALHCPHDLSHSNKDAELTSDRVMIDQSLVKNSSELFKESLIEDLIKETPLLSAFAWITMENGKLTEAQKKVDRIKSSMANPFEKYLPKHDVIQPAKFYPPATAEDNMEEDTAGSQLIQATKVWKMKQHTKETETEETTKPAPDVPVTKSEPEAVEEEGEIVQTVREQVPEQERKKKKKHKRDKSLDADSASSAKKHKSNLTAEELEDQGFKAFDYNAASKQVFQEPKQGKKQRTDPMAQPAPEKNRGPKKHRMPGRGGNKSMTYGRYGGHSSKTHWPKR